MVTVKVYRNWGFYASEGMTKPFDLDFPDVDSAYEWLDVENAKLIKNGMLYRLSIHVIIPIDLLESVAIPSIVEAYPNGCQF